MEHKQIIAQGGIVHYWIDRKIFFLIVLSLLMV